MVSQDTIRRMREDGVDIGTKLELVLYKGAKLEADSKYLFKMPSSSMQIVTTSDDMTDQPGMRIIGYLGQKLHEDGTIRLDESDIRSYQDSAISILLHGPRFYDPRTIHSVIVERGELVEYT